MKTKLKAEAAERVLDILPSGIGAEIAGLCRGRRGGLTEIREIRIRAGGRASLRYGSESLPLFSSATSEDVSEIVSRICGGGVYAHRDKIAAGYLPFGEGVRVGVIGSARYEKGAFVGVEEICSLVFRIPGGVCDITDELFEAFKDAKSGMLIYSPPGGGKTTALRALTRALGSGKRPLRVCVVDEREEFFSEDYCDCEVDILKGYSRRSGLEIATRTMSPEVVIIDEIGCDEAAAIADTVRCGIPIVATAHSSCIEELFSKSSLKPLFNMGAFDVFVGISEIDGRHILTVNKNERNT